MAKRMKICFIAQFPPPIHGLSIAVDTLYKSLDSSYELEKINIVNNKRFLSNCLHIFRSSADLFYLTISQSKMGNLRDLFLLWIIRLKRKKTVIHLHGGYFRELIDHDIPKWQRKKNVKALSKIDRAIVLSESFKNIFTELVEEKKIEVVPNFFDCSEGEAGKSIKEDLTRKKVLYLSNMIESKGYKEVLQLAIIEKKEVKGYHFDFAGAFFEASLQNEFEKIISDNELGDIVTYHGVVEGKKKQKLLDNSDIFILLTRYPKEGQPISIIEAMANGLAIIATDHAAIPDMIKDGENGILVRKETSASDVYKAMRQLDLETISGNNINVANTFYSKSNYINNMRRVFENTMNGIEK